MPEGAGSQTSSVGGATALDTNPPQSPPPADCADILEFIWKAHEYTNEYVRFADAKGGVVFTAAAGLLAALVAAGLHRRVVGHQMTGWSWGELASAVAFVSLVLAALLAAWAIRPRLWNAQRKGFVFWESIRGHATAADFWDELRVQPQSALAEHLAHHLYTIAGVARSKYRWVAVSMWLAIAGGLGGAVLIVSQ